MAGMKNYGYAKTSKAQPKKSAKKQSKKSNY